MPRGIDGSRDIKDETIQSIDIKDGTITNSDISISANIDQSKISQSGGWISSISAGGGNSTSISNYIVKYSTSATDGDGSYDVRRAWITNEGENDAQLFWNDTTDEWEAGIKNATNPIFTASPNKVSGRFNTGTVASDSTTRLNYDGYFYATRVYNAVYNDYADFQPSIDDCEYGLCYYETGSGLKKCNKRAQFGIVGLATDTFGISVGSDDTNKVPIAVSGWVLAQIDKIYKSGTLLVNDKNGKLTKARFYEKLFFPKRIVAQFAREEKEKEWNKIKVNNRHWVKV